MIELIQHLGDAYARQTRFRRILAELHGLPKSELQRMGLDREDIPRRAAWVVYGI